MHWIARTLFAWCWVTLAVVLGMRVDASLDHVAAAHLTAEPSLCRRAGVPPAPGGCVMKANLGWDFLTGRMRVSPTEPGRTMRPVLVTPTEQRSLSYDYALANDRETGGTLGSGVLVLCCLGLGLLPVYPVLRRMTLPRGKGLRT